MMHQWRFTSEATKSVFPLPAKTSNTKASGAQEHATKEADPKPLPNDKSIASEHDAESEPAAAQTSKTNASGAQEHAIKEADCEPSDFLHPDDESSASEHDA